MLDIIKGAAHFVLFALAGMTLFGAFYLLFTLITGGQLCSL